MAERIHLDFHQMRRVDQLRDFHHRRRRTNRAKKLAVHLSYRFPMRDVRDKDTGTHDIGKRNARLMQCAANFLQCVTRLRASITHSDDETILVRRRRTGDPNMIAHPHCARTGRIDR